MYEATAAGFGIEDQDGEAASFAAARERMAAAALSFVRTRAGWERATADQRVTAYRYLSDRLDADHATVRDWAAWESEGEPAPRLRLVEETGDPWDPQPTPPSGAVKMANALWRMADLADARGLQLLIGKHPADGYAVESATERGLLYRVGVHSGCDCAGFGRHGYCSHWALLLAELDLLPERVPADNTAARAAEAEHHAAQHAGRRAAKTAADTRRQLAELQERRAA